MLLNPAGTLSVVACNPEARDPALDDSMDVRAYEQTRDPALIKERTGMRAVRYDLSALDVVFVAEHIDSRLSPSAMQKAAFLASCHVFTDASGERHVAKTKPGAYGQPIADDDWFRKVAAVCGLFGVYELGSVAWLRSRLPLVAASPLG